MSSAAYAWSVVRRDRLKGCPPDVLVGNGRRG